jgi:hypothetical protein
MKLMTLFLLFCCFVGAASAQTALQITTGDSQTNPWLPSGNVGTTFQFDMTLTGGTAPYVWTVSGLPTGVTLTNVATGHLSGVPTQSGNFTLIATVRDSKGAVATRDYNLEVCLARDQWGTTAASCNGFGN